MDIKKTILSKIKRKGAIKSSEIVKMTGFSRAYVNRFFQELHNEGRITKIGKANQTRWILADRKIIEREKANILTVRKKLTNKNIFEDIIFADVRKNSGIFLTMPKNVISIIEYAFTEMLNNAIEHSNSEKIEINIFRDNQNIKFKVIDKGVGIFNHLMIKRKLNSELEAIQDLLKGKQTTAPKEHSGEGIFFTSKSADVLVIQSGRKKLTFHNLLDDIFIDDIKNCQGTKVNFTISNKSKRDLNSIFKKYTNDYFVFERTRVVVKLYKMGSNYISRSQARRIVFGLEKFNKIILDFAKVKSVGQAFADEIFRVWKNKHKNIKILYENANENIDFMIKRAK